MWTLDLPLSVQVNDKKKVHLNLNTYRNLHYYLNNAAKVEFKRLILPLLKDIPKQDKVHLHYEFFAPNQARRDLMNVVCIVDKFLTDVLSEVKVIDDDHTGIVVSNSSAYGGVDRTNPRVSVTIYSVIGPMTVIFDPEQETAS